MEEDTRDCSVPREVMALLSEERLILRETGRAVTPFGGVAVFVAYLRKVGFVEKLRQCMPICWRSPNQIEPAATFTAFLIAVLVGAKRFAHANWLRGDRALHALLGIDRFPTDDTIRNLFRRFTMGNVQRLFEPLAQWQMERVPLRSAGYTLDLDSTVFERYGRQEGSLKGHNPRKHGSFASSPAGCSGRSSLTPPWLAPQRQLRTSTWRGGVSRRSSRAVGTAPEDPPGKSRLWILR